MQESRGDGGREEHDSDFRSRFLSLALEAYRREKISRGRLYELGRLVAKPRDHIDDLLYEDDVALWPDD